MAKGVWISDEERTRILKLRMDGVSVKDIAEQTQRSTNFVYRFLRNANGKDEANKARQTVMNSTSHVAPAPVVERMNETSEHHDELDSSAALLLAVENMEVSPYEPIPQAKCSEQILVQAPTETANVAVRFSSDANASSIPSKSHADDWWVVPPSTSSTFQANSAILSEQHQSLHPPKKQKTSAPKPRTPATTVRSTTVPVSLCSVQNVNPPSVEMESANKDKPLAELGIKIQQEIRQFEGLALSDVYHAQALQLLIKFHAEILLLQLQQNLSSASQHARVMKDDKVHSETSNLLREKLVKEIALLDLQAKHQRLEIEQIRRKTTSTISHNTNVPSVMENHNSTC